MPATTSGPRVGRLPTVIALLVGTFLSSLDLTVVGTAMPRIVAELHGMNQYGWVFAGYLLASTTMVPIYGKLADLLGRRPTYLVAISIFLVGSLLCGLAPSMDLFVAARVVQGLGAGGIYPITMTILGDLFTVEERSRAQGLFAMAWAFSSLAGPAVGGAFVTYWSWRWAFYINLPIGVAATSLLVIYFHDQPGQASRQTQTKRAPLDLLGALLLTLTLVALLASFGRSGVNLPLLGAGVVLLVLLVLQERRAVDAVIPPDLFRDAVFTVGCLANMLFGAVLFAFIAYCPLYLQGAVGFAPMWAGLAGAPTSVTWTISNFLAGRFILRFGYRPVLRAGGLFIVGAAVATWLATTSSLPGGLRFGIYEVGQLFLGAGNGLVQSSLIIAVQDRVPWTRRGAATGSLQLVRQVGATIGTTVLGVFLVELARRRLADFGITNTEVLIDAATNPDKWGLSGQSAAAVRDILGGALRWVALIVVGFSAVAALTTLFFPDIRARPRPATDDTDDATTPGSADA